MFFALLSGLLGGTSSILYFESVAGGPISIVGTVSATYPAWTAVIARLFLAEHLSPLQYVGVVVVILGCMGVAYEPSDKSDAGEKTTNRLWFLQANLAAAGWGVSGVVTDHAYELPNASEANLVLFAFLGGVLTLGPYGLLRSRGRKFSQREFTRGALPMAMFTVGNLLLTFAFRHGDATLVQTLSSPYPAITLVFAFIILKERPTFLQWVCIVLILVGMVLCPGVA
ncbi:MAG: DMT family transporter [Acidobacteriota bacterium]|nr:MAG: DMT family transporter [Acidobacteriota bacterium]